MKYLQFNKPKKKIKIIRSDNKVIVKGPLGSVFVNLTDSNEPNFFIPKDSINYFSNQIKKAIKSVSTGWFVELNLNGLGYKSFKLEDKLAFDIGYSNLVTYKPSNLIKVKNLKNKVTLFSINLIELNNAVKLIQNYSKPDAYKGKGILKKNQFIKLKKKK